MPSIMNDETYRYSFTSHLSSGAFYEVDIWKSYLMILRGFGPNKTVWATELTPDLLKDIKALSENLSSDVEVADAIFERFYSAELEWRAVYDIAAWKDAFFESLNGRKCDGILLATFDEFVSAFDKYAENTLEYLGRLLPQDEMPDREVLVEWWDELVEQFPQEEDCAP